MGLENGAQIYYFFFHTKKQKKNAFILFLKLNFFAPLIQTFFECFEIFVLHFRLFCFYFIGVLILVVFAFFCLFSVVEYVDTFAYDNYRDANDKMSDSEQNSDDEDSNDENFWRNDYPDEDDYDEDSIGDEDMRRAVEDFDIGKNISKFIAAI